MTVNVIAVFEMVDDSANTDHLKKAKLDGFKQLKSVAVLRGDYRVDTLRNHGIKEIVEYNSWERVIGAVLKGAFLRYFSLK
jgi:hypothetical protein